MAADNIRVHRNAKMMFHGAWTVSIGGKELHQDTAALLEKINGDIKARLVSKYGMAPETVSEWFAEGREGWLSAPSALVVRYEDLIASDAEMRRIADFLGVPYVDDAWSWLPGLTRSWHPTHSDWRTLWTPQVEAVWTEIGGPDLLARWGY
jgi:hypothetical protein